MVSSSTSSTASRSSRPSKLAATGFLVVAFGLPRVQSNTMSGKQTVSVNSKSKRSNLGSVKLCYQIVKSRTHRKQTIIFENLTLTVNLTRFDLDTCIDSSTATKACVVGI